MAIHPPMDQIPANGQLRALLCPLPCPYCLWHHCIRCITCPANACAAVDHNGWLRALPLGACAHAADSQPLLAPDHSQEVNERSCRGRDTIIWPAQELKVGHLAFLPLLEWEKKQKLTRLFLLAPDYLWLF